MQQFLRRGYFNHFGKNFNTFLSRNIVLLCVKVCDSDIPLLGHNFFPFSKLKPQPGCFCLWIQSSLPKPTGYKKRSPAQRMKKVSFCGCDKFSNIRTIICSRQLLSDPCQGSFIKRDKVPLFYEQMPFDAGFSIVLFQIYLFIPRENEGIQG